MNACDNQITEVVSPALDVWLAERIPGYRSPGTLSKFSFGQSNPTYRLQSAGKAFVLRRKPLGQLLPKAHQIEREFRVLRGLENSGVPVPRVFAYCDDPLADFGYHAMV